MLIDELWKETLEELEKHVNRPAFEMFVKRIEPESMDDDTFHLKVRGGAFSNEFLNEYRKSIEDTLSNIANRKMAISVRFDESTADKQLDNSKSGIDPAGTTYIGDPASAMTEEPAPPRRKPIPSNTTLNEMYMFETFVVGESNQFCYNTSRAVAEKPGVIANPLFIYGDVGLGKTHLLHAIGNYVLATRPDLKVVHRHASAFVNEMMNHIKDGKLVEFRNHYLQADLFLIDDIHNLKGREGTQNEFFQIFNAFYENQRQIVVTCDRPPKELRELEERVVSRLGWGVIADIQIPNFETRLAILKRKLASENITDEEEFPEEVLEYIAGKISTNIRDLEGALLSIRARAKYNHQSVTIDLAEEVVNNIAPPKDPREVTPSSVLKLISSYFDVPEEEILGKRRKKEIVHARMIAMYLIRSITNIPLTSIGDFFGKDHSSVLYAHEKISNEIKNDAQLKRTVATLQDKIVG